MRIYLPRSLAISHVEAIRSVPAPAGVRVSIQHGVCDLGAVRCATIRFGCTSLWIRTPFVYPFSLGNLRNEFPGEYHIGGSIDWIWLGRNAQTFREYFDELVGAMTSGEITVILFDVFSGILEQKIDEAEVCATLPRGVMNYNLPQWVAACENMLHAPETEWGRFAANSVDFYPKLRKHLAKYAVHSPKNILDLGCGVGQTTRSLAAAYPGARVYGLDACQQAINVAKQHFRAPNLEFLVGGIGSRLPLPDGCLDVIVSVNALMYGENQLKTAEEVFRVLAPGGTLIHYSRSLESHMFWDFPRSLLGPTNFQLNLADWISAATRTGFETFIRSPVDMLTTFPGFFAPASSKEFCRLYEQSLTEEKGKHGQLHHPWHSHALVVHSQRVKSNAGDHCTSAYLQRLDDALSCLPVCSDQQKLALAVGWKVNAGSLDQCMESSDFLAHILPKTGGMAASILQVTA